MSAQGTECFNDFRKYFEINWISMEICRSKKESCASLQKNLSSK